MKRIPLNCVPADKAAGVDCPVDLSAIMCSCGVDEGLCGDFRSILPYLSRYLYELGVKLAVIESDYIDCDYLDDYARYYARCFEKHDRTCHRVHFFGSDFSEQELRTIVSAAEGQEEELIERFEASYMGFVVLRPLPKTIVGRTCLKSYPEDGADRNCRSSRAFG